MTGTIVSLKLDRGFGFIRSDGRDYFFHCAELQDGLQFDGRLQERLVQFDETERDGKARAVNVQPARAWTDQEP